MTAGVDRPGPHAPQEKVQQWLDSFPAVVDLGGRLLALERWCRAAGYFDHLAQENLYIDLRGGSGDGAALAMQVNYSREGYRPPAGGSACPLCFENVASEAKPHLRVHEFTLAGGAFFAHPTPFPLRPGHCVVNAREHEPMRIDGGTFREVSEFLARAKGWLAACNSDREGTGASVLGHHHVQIFPDLRLPVEDAPAAEGAVVAGDVEGALLNWPAAVFRLEGEAEHVSEVYSRLLDLWRPGDPENRSANFLARREGSRMTVHFFPRQRDFRTPGDLLEFKSEGVGIIEMAGELILPPRPVMNREENRAFFEREGYRIGYGIVSGNSPGRAQYPDEFWLSILREAAGA